MELGSSGGVLGQEAPAGVPLAVGPTGAGPYAQPYISLAVCAGGVCVGARGANPTSGVRRPPAPPRTRVCGLPRL
jgi:hypothetical protein